MNKFNLRDKVKIAGSDAIFEIYGIQIVSLVGKEEACYRMNTNRPYTEWQPESVLSAYVEPRPEPKFKVGDKVRLEGNDKVFEVSGISVDQFIDGQDAIRYYLLNEWPLVKGVNERDLTLYAEPKFKVGDAVYCRKYDMTTNVEAVQRKPFNEFYRYEIGKMYLADEDELVPIPKAKFKVGEQVRWERYNKTSNVETVKWDQDYGCYYYSICKIHLVAEDHLESVSAKAAREGFELAQKVAPFLKIDWTLALGYRITVKPQEDNQ